jgi:hypothetical protein
MRTHNEIFKDLQKYSEKLICCKKEDFQTILVEYNIILKEFDDYYKIYCSNCNKDNLMYDSSS